MNWGIAHKSTYVVPLEEHSLLSYHVESSSFVFIPTPARISQYSCSQDTIQQVSLQQGTKRDPRTSCAPREAYVAVLCAAFVVSDLRIGVCTAVACLKKAVQAVDPAHTIHTCDTGMCRNFDVSYG